jgi:hypothetical protein
VVAPVTVETAMTAGATSISIGQVVSKPNHDSSVSRRHGDHLSRSKGPDLAAELDWRACSSWRGALFATALALVATACDSTVQGSPPKTRSAPATQGTTTSSLAAPSTTSSPRAEDQAASEAEGRCSNYRLHYAEVAFKETHGLVLNSSVYDHRPTGLIARTPDAGETWSVAYKSATAIRDVQWIDGKRAVAAAQEGLLASSDAGGRWEVVGPRSDLCRLAFLSASSGFALDTEGRVLRTADGGTSFTAVDIGVDADDIVFSDARHGWVAGANGIVATVDGGRTWQRQLKLPGAGYANWKARLALFDAAHGSVLYSSANTLRGIRPGRLFYTEDGGRHWTEQAWAGLSSTAEHGIPPPEPTPGAQRLSNAYPDFSMSGARAIVMLSYSFIGPRGGYDVVHAKKSTDAGRTWSAANDLPLFSSDVSGSGPAATAAAGPSAWWVAVEVAGQDGSRRLVIAFSSDQGVSWTVKAEQLLEARQ